jgi:hypothetical protein
MSHHPNIFSCRRRDSATLSVVVSLLLQLVRRITERGYRNMASSKNREASVTGALSRDVLFTRLGPALYALAVSVHGAHMACHACHMRMHERMSVFPAVAGSVLEDFVNVTVRLFKLQTLYAAVGRSTIVSPAQAVSRKLSCAMSCHILRICSRL